MCFREPHEYAHVSVISFLLLMNHEPLILHKQRTNAGSERGAKPPGRQLYTSYRRSRASPRQCCRTTGRGSGWAPFPRGCWVPAASAQGGGVQPAWLEREGTIVKGGCWLWASNSFGVSSVGGEWGEQKASAFSPGRVASEMSPCVLGAVWVTYAPTGRTEAYYTHVSSSTAPQIKHRLKPFIVLNLKNQIHGHQDDAPGS